MAKRLKLYVWENVLTDYRDGVMFAYAHDEDEARELLEKKVGYHHQDMEQKPKEIVNPEGFYVYGSS